MTKKKKFQTGDLIYFEKDIDDLGMILEEGRLQSGDTFEYKVFWFRTNEYGWHTEFYLSKLKRQS